MDILAQLETMWADFMRFQPLYISSSSVVPMAFRSQLLYITAYTMILLPPEDSPNLLLFMW